VVTSSGQPRQCPPKNKNKGATGRGAKGKGSSTDQKGGTHGKSKGGKNDKAGAVSGAGGGGKKPYRNFDDIKDHYKDDANFLSIIGAINALNRQRAAGKSTQNNRSLIQQIKQGWGNLSAEQKTAIESTHEYYNIKGMLV
jgi:hypothetical protein